MNDDKASDFSAIAQSLINSVAFLGFNSVPTALSVVSPILQRILEKGFRMFHRDSIAKVECARLGIAYITAVKTTNQNLDSGKPLRNDGFFDAINNEQYTVADEIIEATLRNVIIDAETRKSEIYGRFIGNIPFLSGCPADDLIRINSILRQLTMVDLDNLSHFSDGKVHSFHDLEMEVKSQENSPNAIRLASLFRLKDLGLIIRVPPAYVGYDIDNERITVLGRQVLEIARQI